MEKRIKYRVTCASCGNVQMLATEAKVREPYTKDNFLPALECEVCGHIQVKPEGIEPMKPVLQKTVSNADADEALKKVCAAAQVLIEHAEASGTVFIGCITIDGGHGNRRAGDFFIGEAEDMAKAIARLLHFRPELSRIMRHAVSLHSMEPLLGRRESDGAEVVANHDPSINLAAAVENIHDTGGRPAPDFRGVKVYLDNVAPGFVTPWVIESKPLTAKEIQQLKNVLKEPIKMRPAYSEKGAPFDEKLPRSLEDVERKISEQYFENGCTCNGCTDLQGMKLDAIRDARIKAVKNGCGLAVKRLFDEYGISTPYDNNIAHVLPRAKYNELLTRLNDLLNIAKNGN